MAILFFFCFYQWAPPETLGCLVWPLCYYYILQLVGALLCSILCCLGSLCHTVFTYQLRISRHCLLCNRSGQADRYVVATSKLPVASSLVGTTYTRATRNSRAAFRVTKQNGCIHLLSSPKTATTTQEGERERESEPLQTRRVATTAAPPHQTTPTHATHPTMSPPRCPFYAKFANSTLFPFVLFVVIYQQQQCNNL